MADRRSALAHLGASGAADAAVSLREMHFGSILQVAAWPGTVATVQGVMAVLLGVAVPKMGNGIVEKDAIVAAVSPGRFLVAGEADDLVPRFEAALPSADAAVTDLSHGRVILRLDGAAAEILGRCAAVDCDPHVFPPGRVAQTAIHHIDVVIHRLTATSFDLWVARSFAGSLVEWVIDAGAEAGVAFRG